MPLPASVVAALTRTAARLRRVADAANRRFGPHLGARIALVVGLAFGVVAFVGAFGLLPDDDAHPLYAMNFHVYYVAAEAAVSGGPIYEVTPDYPGDDTYLYPPILVVPFLPFLLVEPMTGFYVFTLLSVLASVAGGLLVVRYLRETDATVTRLDAALIVAFVVASTHAVPTLYFGNVNLLLGVGAIVGFLAVERERPILGGVSLGLVGLVKAFPALLGLYLLRLRSLRASLAWAATGAGGLLAGVVVFGRETTEAFFVDVLLPRSDTEAFVGGLDPGGTFYVTIRRPLSHLIWWVAPDADAVWLTVLSVAFGAGVLAVCYRGLDTRQDRLVAMLATAAVAVTVVASFRLYLVLLYFPLLALLYTFEGPGRWPFLAGAVLFSVSRSPEWVLDALSAAPEPVAAVLGPPASVISIQLLGILLLLGGCMRWKVAGEKEPVG